MKWLKGVRAYSSKNVKQLIAEVYSLYTDARSMPDKQEDLKAIVQLGSYDLTTITKMWRHEFCNWSTTISGYKLFLRDRQG